MYLERCKPLLIKPDLTWYDPCTYSYTSIHKDNDTMARKLAGHWTKHHAQIRLDLHNLLSRTRQPELVDVLITTLNTIQRCEHHAVLGWDFPDTRLLDVRYMDCPQGKHAIITICVPPEHNLPGVKRKGRQWLLQLTFSPYLETSLFSLVRQQSMQRMMKLSQLMIRDLKQVDSNLIDLDGNLLDTSLGKLK